MVQIHNKPLSKTTQNGKIGFEGTFPFLLLKPYLQRGSELLKGKGFTHETDPSYAPSGGCCCMDRDI